MRTIALALLMLTSCSNDSSPPVNAALAAPPPMPPPEPPTVTIHDADLQPLFEHDTLWAALTARKHSKALGIIRALDKSTLSGSLVADVAFLEAWTALRADQGASVVALLDTVRQAKNVPPAYVQLTVGELLLEDGRNVEAAQILQAVPADAPVHVRAQLKAAEALHAAGSTKTARDIYAALIERPDPSDGSHLALWGLALKIGPESPDAYPYLRRLWAHYPRTQEGRLAARKLPVHEGRGSQFRATDLEIAQRADALMGSWAFDSAISLLKPRMARYTTPSEASCLAWYVYGRSQFKKNNVTIAAQVLTPAGESCAGIDDDRGAKALYIAGKALERKKAWSSAAKVYQQIPEKYPAHTMADDGYTLAGIGWQESGQLDQAMDLWAKQVAAYPEGDLAAEGFWRLAWNSYRQGDTDAAIRWAEQMVWTVPITSDPVHVMAGRYWAGRWKLYPNVDDPSKLNTDADAVAQGVRDLKSLCEAHPTRFYALLAAARLYEVAPEALAEVKRPLFSGERARWVVDEDVAEGPNMKRALQLRRMGLIQEALDELAVMDKAALGPTGMAMRATMQADLNPIVAHDQLHKYLLDHPPSTYPDNQLPVLTTAYPEMYWDLVQQAADGYGYDPRIFHALVREESSFNKDIVSWAGARGLSQLMPATAKQVGGWLGITVTKQSSFDPLTNLRIGSRYMEFLQDRYHGNMFLAVAGYNAGQGNVDKWLRERGNTPTDEFVENIPYRETRGYVKRVLGTYQLYHTLYDDDAPLFFDFSGYNHEAKRSSG
ncbi:MAG: transglycosylase SLT domain-containing protein [Myxococcota bacterium]